MICKINSWKKVNLTINFDVLFWNVCLLFTLSILIPENSSNWWKIEIRNKFVKRLKRQWIWRVILTNYFARRQLWWLQKTRQISGKAKFVKSVEFACKINAWRSFWILVKLMSRICLQILITEICWHWEKRERKNFGQFLFWRFLDSGIKSTTKAQ